MSYADSFAPSMIDRIAELTARVEILEASNSANDKVTLGLETDLRSMRRTLARTEDTLAGLTPATVDEWHEHGKLRDHCYKAAAAFYASTPEIMLAPGRQTSSASSARALAWLWMHQRNVSYKDIGRSAGRDHSTVITAVANLTHLIRASRLSVGQIEALGKGVESHRRLPTEIIDQGPLVDPVPDPIEEQT